MVLPSWATGTPITDPSSLSSHAILIDFEDIATDGALVTSLSNPFTIGDVTFSSLTGSLSILDISVSGWAANGTEVASRTLFPGGEPDSAIAIDFDNPIAEFLMGWGDPNFVGNRLMAFDSRGNLLETAYVENGVPGGGHAAWIGFQRRHADIARILVQPDQSLPSGDDYVIDNIYYSARNPHRVPEPSTLLMLSSGVLLAWYRRRNATPRT
jgi:hypothetical protein